MKRFWSRALAGVLVLSALGGCDLAPGKPFSWKSTVNTEFIIPSGDRLNFAYYQFGEAFQIGSGTLRGKMQINVPGSVIGTVPRQIGLDFDQFGQQGQTPITSYRLTAPLKMRPLGNGYQLTYKFTDRSVPAFNLAQFDYIRVGVQPDGGSIGKGWQVYGAYAFTPHK